MRVLTPNMFLFVIDHLEHHISLHDIKKHFHYGNSSDEKGIIFKTSSSKLNYEEIFHINQIPILFPLGTEKKWYSIINNQLVFEHDIIKSSFYFLSGAQEYKANRKDTLGRFDYNYSIQKKLNITSKPIVNYYFEIIINGIKEFCNLNKIPFERKKLITPNFHFLLSHDVDRVKYFNFKELIYNTKSFLGIAPKRLSKKTLLRTILTQSLNLVFPIKKDPFWNFDFLLKVEKKLQIKSSYYFLPKGDRNVDANYNFSSKKIRRLIKELTRQGHEIGLHGTVRSASENGLISNNKNQLEKTTKTKVIGNRQHRLSWLHPNTALNLAENNFVYDTSLGYANHEGFRNSYCHPFKVYDFDKDCSINFWEIPLIAMDCTFFDYQKYDFLTARKKILALINESKKFNGIFTLLWHNSYFEEEVYPGITDFYNNLLIDILKLDPENILPHKLLKKYHT